MKFYLDGLLVYFPFPYIYPEQYNYMLALKRTLDAQGHCALEMPSGTGKTISLLSLVTSYQLAHPEVGKLIYCSRTVPEIEKALLELQRLIAFRDGELGAAGSTVLCLGLSSRKNLCIHPEVSEEVDGKVVDAACRSMTASFRREQAATNGAIELCDFYEGLENAGTEAVLPPGVYTLEDLRIFGHKKGWCPYYLARRMIRQANVIVYSYQYLLDPKIASLVSNELSKDSVVVFDEAHNIDNVCIEALSIHLDKTTLDASKRAADSLTRTVGRLKQNDMDRLNNEYQRLVEGLAQQGALRAADELLANPVLPDDILNEAIPGNIRKAEHFCALLNRFIEYLKTRIREKEVQSESPMAFLLHCARTAQIEAKPLKFLSERLASLLRTLEVVDLEEVAALKSVADFGTLVATYMQGFTLIFEPHDNFAEPVLNFCCLDASIAIAPVFKRFRTVCITSGTLSPIDMYPRMLKFTPSLVQTFTMSLSRECFLPLVITRGNDQAVVSSKYSLRNDQTVLRNYGKVLVEMCATVPDGVVCFFPSYRYMESVVAVWHTTGIIADVLKNKLLFVETQNIGETTLALDNYRKACDNGRGAVLLSVARGKVSEGIDFAHHYGRAVILVGIPYIYTESRILKARLEFLRTECQIREADFLTFDAMRTAAQCVGRVIRGKTDYGVMVFADKRYGRVDKRNKLPQWIQDQLRDSNLNLSTQDAVLVTKRFLRVIAQPIPKDERTSRKSLWSKEYVDTLPTSAVPFNSFVNRDDRDVHMEPAPP